MTANRNVAETALVVAEFRAEENQKPYPLYRDPFVHLFLSDESRRAADRIFSSFAPIKAMVWLRTRYLDDRLEQQLQRGYRQVVILGAGLDTRAERKSAASVAYFEIDDERILSFKKERLAEHGIRARVTYIACNYVEDDFLGLLERNEFDFKLPSHFIWEGNTMYLTEDAVGRVLSDIAHHLDSVSVSFDYMAEEVIAKTTGDRQITEVVERFAAMGAPWTCGINDLQRIADKTGMAIAENFEMAALHRAFWPNMPFDSSIYDYYSICTLQKVA